MKLIKGVVIDGFHRGHNFHMEYSPTIKLLRPKITRVDYCCGGGEVETTPMDYDEYKVCFTAVDGRTALYSTSGKSDNAFLGFGWDVSEKPWSLKTHLYMGYHNEPIRRTDEDTLTHP